jgi:hypothetical protein
MNTDDLHKALSAKITAAVIEHKSDKWPEYFTGLRDLIGRVVNQTESDLAAEEKQALIQQLLDHVSALEKWWPKLKPEKDPCQYAASGTTSPE